MREYSHPGMDTAVQRPVHEDHLGGAAARNISRMYTLLPALTFLPLFLLVEGGIDYVHSIFMCENNRKSTFSGIFFAW